MSNGYIRKKVVQWVFRDKIELLDFVPKYEGAYALDNEKGDIYIWNGVQWLLYREDVVQPYKTKRSKSAGYRRVYWPPIFPENVSFYCDVDLLLGNLIEQVNAYDDRSFSTDKSLLNTYVNLYLGSSLECNTSFSSGSFYTEPSFSIA